MSDLKIETVEKMIAEWNNAFRGPVERTADELFSLAKIYHRDLNGENVTEKQFKWAAVQAGKRTDFFPTRRLILECVSEYRMNPPRNNMALPETTSWHNPTKKERELASRIAELAKQAASGGISYAEAAERMEELR